MSTSSSTSLNSSSSMSMSRKDIILESYLVKTGPLNKALPLVSGHHLRVYSTTSGAIMYCSTFLDVA